MPFRNVAAVSKKRVAARSAEASATPPPPAQADAASASPSTTIAQRASIPRAAKRAPSTTISSAKPAKEPRTAKNKVTAKSSASQVKVPVSEDEDEQYVPDDEFELSDNEEGNFDESDVKQTGEEEEVEAIQKRYSNTVKHDENGERVFKTLIMVHNGTQELGYGGQYALSGTALQLFFADIWTARLRHSVAYRVKRAKEIGISEVTDSCYTMGFWQMYCHLDVDKYVAWCNKHTPLETRARLGVPIKTGKELLDLPPFSNQSYFKWWAGYFLIITDKDGNIVAIYPGSGTDKRGVGARWCGYDNIIANSRLGTLPSEPFARNSYMHLLVQQGYKIHVRPVLRVDPTTVRPMYVVAFEGHLTDVFNTLNLKLPFFCRGRNQAVLAQFPGSVPEDMKDVTYGKPNLAHQLKQGSRAGNPSCAMIGHGCTHEANTKTFMMYQLEGDLLFGCRPAYNSLYSFRSFNPKMNAYEIVEQWMENWRKRGLTGKFMKIPKDSSCECCRDDDNSSRSLSRIILNETMGHIVCGRCYELWVNNHWREKVSRDMDSAACDDVWFEFMAWAIEYRAPKGVDVEVECACSTSAHTTLGTETLPGSFPWGKRYTKLCPSCKSLWASHAAPATKKGLLNWQKAHPMDTVEQFIEECLNSAASRRLKVTDLGCVCSTAEKYVAGTKVQAYFPWIEQYPKICENCYKAWKSVVSHRGRESNKSDIKWCRDNPMTTVEEFIEYARVYSGRTKRTKKPKESEETAPAEEAGTGSTLPSQRLLVHDDPLDRPLDKPVFK